VVIPLNVGDVPIGTGGLTIVAGPCLAESEDVCFRVCDKMQALCAKHGFGYIFKASFDKANRTSGETTRGHGMSEGLALIRKTSDKFNVPSTTDVHLPDQALVVSGVVDLLQVPAFLCRQSDLLEACAETGKPVNVKKGQFLAPQDANNIVSKLASFGSKGTMLTERGTTFGYTTLIVDMPGLEIMRSFGVPVCFDATHSAQRPGGEGASSGGNRDSIPALVRAALAVGVDALFMEVHPDPSNALSDAATQWPLDRAEEMMEMVARVQAVSGI
jgi:2-dehydro-3-deoxyphosphooctonate aldolase (KDO 8-P synthase)